MMKVLVVDDDSNILEAVSFVLEEFNYSVETISKGDETYEKVKKFKPDVILLDLLISGSDGRKVCLSLKQNNATKNIPIVLISAHPKAKAEAISCEADDFLAKPFDTDDLLNILSKYTNTN